MSVLNYAAFINVFAVSKNPSSPIGPAQVGSNLSGEEPPSVCWMTMVRVCVCVCLCVHSMQPYEVVYLRKFCMLAKY